MRPVLSPTDRVISRAKHFVIALIGREAANRISAPYHDWVAHRRTQQRLDMLPRSGLRVNLGCGIRPLSGWINLDVARNSGVDLVWDVRRGLPFRSGTCSFIFIEHVIEHMSKTDAQRLLRELLRVLEPGGVVRISTPDAGRYLRSYVGDGEFLRDRRFAQAIETPIDRINIMMHQDGQHLWAYDARALLLLIKQAGFFSAVEQEFGCSLSREMRGIDDPERAFESLYVEARK